MFLSLPHRKLTIIFVATLGFATQAAPQAAIATAWKDGSFHIDRAGVVSRSDVVLLKPNKLPEQAMPLGNGGLGVAVWSEGGLRLQLNRADTLPSRLSPGQVLLPGLTKLMDAADYQGRLDLYHGEFQESGGGLTATVYVEPSIDAVVIEVRGAAPNVQQTAQLYLWQPRHASQSIQSNIALLSETWRDSTEAGASGQTFGSLSAVTAEARELHVARVNPLTVQLAFLPRPDGSFRIFIAAPQWNGGENALRTAAKVLNNARSTSFAEHRQWWQDFWDHTALIKLTSADGSAEYFENLRCIDLFTAAAESLGPLPGSQAGIGDLFSSVRDEHKWGPSAYWHWNLRMQVAANLGAGLFRFNESYFKLYRDNLPNIQAWTKGHMADRPGVCVPETMRFNGQGYENETWLKEPGLNCDAESKPYYNARTLSTGAEVSLWMWRQYLATGDKAFLSKNYPLMAESARFLLAYLKQGTDGLLHMFPSNAHETQWDVHDPTTDLAAMKAFFPALLKATKILGVDPDLARQVESTLSKLPELPVKDSALAQSYDENAPIHNSENIGLEVAWPYSLIGDVGPLHNFGVETYRQRPNKFDDDWSFDPIQAARLGLADEAKTALINLTEKYQEYPSGFAKFMGPEFYVEQIGVVADALQEMVVQDYDGLVRIAPAWPKSWDGDATVYIQQNSKIDVQIRDGVPILVVIEAGFDGHIKVRNPWPGESVTEGTNVLQGEELDIVVKNGESYALQPARSSNPPSPFTAVTGTSATRPKSLGARYLGIP